MGAGDGLFVYNRARFEPHTFFIGIDANRRPLQKISEKIHRKPAKGGLPNVLFVQSAVESLPEELNGVAGEVIVNFPWGSLLAAVMGVNPEGLINLKRVCSVRALLRVVMSLDEVRDRTEIERLQLPSLSRDDLRKTLLAQYQSAGFEIVEFGVGNLGARELETSWAKRLRTNSYRSLIRLVAKAEPVGTRH